MDVIGGQATNPFAQASVAKQNVTGGKDNWRSNVETATRIGAGVAQGAVVDPVMAGVQLLGGTDIAHRQAEDYKKMRQNMGGEGFDFARLTGNVVSPGATMAGAKILSRIPTAGNFAKGAYQGLVSSLLTPTETKEGQDYKDYLGNKLLQTTIGTGVGGVAGKLLGPSAKQGVSSPHKTQLDKVDEFEKTFGGKVYLTPGMRSGHQELEQKISSNPVLGPVIHNQRIRSLEDVNKAFFNDVLENSVGKKLSDSTKPGHDAFKEAGRLFSEKYDEVLPQLKIKDPNNLNDALFGTTNINNLSKHGYSTDGLINKELRNLTPANREEVLHTIQNDVMGSFNKAQNGQYIPMTGSEVRELQTAIRNLAKDVRGSGNTQKTKMSDIYEKIASELDNHIEGPQGAKEAYKALQNGYAKYKILEEAGASAPNSSGLFTPSQILSASKTSSKKYTGTRGQFARGDALLQQKAELANDVLGKAFPNSGTADRLISQSPTGWLLGAMAHGILRPTLYSDVGSKMVGGTSNNVGNLINRINVSPENVGRGIRAIQAPSSESQQPYASGGYTGPLSNQGTLSSMGMGPLTMLHRAMGGKVYPKFDDGGFVSSESLVGNFDKTSAPLSQMIKDYAQNLGKKIMEGHEKNQQLHAQAFANPQRPFQVTDKDALSELGDRMFEGVSGFAPAGIFIGKSSPMWNKMMQKEAEKLEKAKVSPEEIWKATGTGRGIGGAWRQEIDDSAMTLKKSIPSGWNNLEDVLNHPELLKAYPSLRQSELTYSVNLPKNVSGGARPMSGSPEKTYFELNKLDPLDEKTSTLVHELQHHIQRQEGFPQGGNIHTAKPVAQKLYGKNVTPNQIEDTYRRLGGEVEAEIARARQYLSDKQRRQNFPFKPHPLGYRYDPKDIITEGYFGGLPIK